MKELYVLKHNDRQKIILCEENNKKYIKREIEDDRREIYKTLQKIENAGIPKILSVAFDGKTVVYEEFVEGKSLASLMEEGYKFSKREVEALFLGLTEIVGALHSEKIIHRDIKPDNILIGKTGVWLIDYDIARIYRPELRKDTEKMGTFGYAPIEQYGVLPTDFKTDIYALGATMQVLMNFAGIKGCLYKISQKCKRLDPSQRYKSTRAVKRAIMCRKSVPFAVLGFALLIGFMLCFFTNIGETTYNELLPTKEVWESTAYTEPATEKIIVVTENKPLVPKTESVPPTEKPTEKTEEPQLDEKEFFAGFEPDEAMLEYRKYPNYSAVAIFSMYEAWDHLLFLSDVNKKGKIKLGDNTLVDADITLNNGRLSVFLKDKYNHEFYHEFEYTGQYEYTQSNPPDRKNADLICCDVDLDGKVELMVGLNEGCIGVFERMFYNNFNYCIAWCIDYDENEGFTLCEGDMFTTDYSFHMMPSSRTFSVNWNEWGDITGYYVEDKRIIPSY